MNSTVNTNRIATLQDSKGRLYEVTDFPYVIGRDEDVDLLLSGQSVSRRHAKIELENGRYLLIDLASTNGTWVNNKKVSQMYLESQDSVRFGDEKLSFVLMHPAHARVMTSSRLGDDLEIKRPSTKSKVENDEEPIADSVTEDRNWFIWIVALVILLAMLGSAYLIFQIRGGSLGQGMDLGQISESEIQLANQSTAEQPSDDELQPVDEVIEQQITTQKELNNFIKSLSTDSSDKTALSNSTQANGAVNSDEQKKPKQSTVEQQRELNAKLVENNGWPELSAVDAVEVKPVKSADVLKEESKPALAAAKPIEVISPKKTQSPKNNLATSKNPEPSKNDVAQKAPVVESSKKINADQLVAASERDKVGGDTENNIPDPISMYLTGKAPAAMNALEDKIAASENAKQKAALMKQRQTIQTLYQQYKLGQTALASGEKNQAFQQWLSFLSNEKAFISGLKHPQNNVRSQYAREIAKNVGEEYYARGEAAKAEKKFADAYRYWMLAAKFEDSPKALANANTIEEFARNLYRQAEFKEIKNPQEGIRLWKQVLTILPADHELHRKAQAKLARSQQP